MIIHTNMLPYINIYGHLIPTYGLLIVLGFVVVTIICAVRAKRLHNVPYDYILVIAAIALAMAIIFGRAFYILVTYPWRHIVASIVQFDFSIFSNSGLVFYGGLFGGILGAFWAGKILRFDIMKMEGILVPLIPLGQAIGRIGCLLSGCCFGMEYNGPLAIRYMHSIYGLSPEKTYLPIQLIASGADVLMMCFLLVYARQKRARGQIVYSYLISYACVRFVLEFFRGDMLRGMFWGLSTSQWISILLVITCMILHKKHTNLQLLTKKY